METGKTEIKKTKENGNINKLKIKKIDENKKNYTHSKYIWRFHLP